MVCIAGDNYGNRNEFKGDFGGDDYRPIQSAHPQSE